MQKKKLIIIGTALVLVIGLGFGIFFGGNAMGENNYWQAAPITDIESVGDYTQDVLDEMAKTYDEEEKEVIDYLKQENVIRDLSAEEQKVISECNALITRYFKETYNIDVSDRLAVLQAKIADFSLSDELQGLAGYYNNYEDDGIVYVGSQWVEEGDFFKETYIHETLHYLGIAQDGSGNIIYIYEGITQYVTHEIFRFGEICTDSGCVAEETYIEYVDVATEIIKQTPDVVRNAIEGEGKYDLETKLDTAFGGKGFADRLNAALQDMAEQQKGAWFNVSLLVREYVKATGGESVSLELDDHFGWRWLWY